MPSRDSQAFGPNALARTGSQEVQYLGNVKAKEHTKHTKQESKAKMQK